MENDKLMVFDDENMGVCPRCKNLKHSVGSKLIMHPRCSYEVEVCGECYADFIRLNDIFFRGLI